MDDNEEGDEMIRQAGSCISDLSRYFLNAGVREPIFWCTGAVFVCAILIKLDLGPGPLTLWDSR